MRKFPNNFELKLELSKQSAEKKSFVFGFVGL
jgi:hypothetical protein